LSVKAFYEHSKKFDQTSNKSLYIFYVVSI
jgi:hypothetical protein